VARILITEEIAQSGVDQLVEAGHKVDIKYNLSPDELLTEIIGAHALIIRSATKVTKEVIQAGQDLVVIGRAGIGLDNVDVNEATLRGVMVVNAPQSNIVSAAEQAFALLLSQARNTPQAHVALKNGKWERSKWEGVEIYGKTLGIIGLGRVGALVAQRALAFGMRLIAYDPFVTADRAKKMGVELMTLDEVVSQSDFITVHLPKTQETIGLINKELLNKMKQGVRIVNTARGGLIDEQALYEAIKDGKVQGAALDVFEKEPCTDSPLFELDSVVVAPHLGASTVEAQDKAGITIAEQVLLALEGAFVPYAVNINASQASEEVGKFLSLAEQLGQLFAGLNEGLPDEVEIIYQGKLADEDTGILTLSILKGIFSIGTDDPVSYVNAPQLAKEKGLVVKESKTNDTGAYVNLITLRSKEHSIAGTLVGINHTPRIVLVDDHVIEVPPAINMLIVRNDDRPGMIGIVGTVLGKYEIGISSMAVGPSTSGNTALMVLSTNTAIRNEIVQELRNEEGIIEVHKVGIDNRQ
jgi:D-3-phosphoglycerate dehydrogenase